MRPTTIADLERFDETMADIRSSRCDPAPDIEFTLEPEDFRLARLGPCNLRLGFYYTSDRVILREQGTRRWMVVDLFGAWSADLPTLAYLPGPEPHFSCRTEWPAIASSDESSRGALAS